MALAVYSSVMWRMRPVPHVLGATTLAFLLCCTAWGCDGDGPVEPEPISVPELFGNQLFRADGSTVSVQTLQNVAVIGIYFASPGCPACGAFTPLLVNAYQQLQEDARSFEVVLVSLIGSDTHLIEYMVDSNMPWLAVSSQGSIANSIVQRYDVRWVPTLIIIDGAANTISLTGREELTQNGPAAYDDWQAARGGA